VPDDRRFYVDLASGHVMTGEAIFHRLNKTDWRFLDKTDEAVHVIETEDGEVRRYLPEERVALRIEVE
jgi:hypothetical protein